MSTPGTELVPYSERLGVSTIVEHGQLSEDQVAYFVKQFAGCPQADIKGFFWVVEKYELNPFGVAQIYGIPRNVRVKKGNDWEDQKRLTVQVGINGLVKIAQQTGRYAGMTEPMWAGKDGIWRPIWNQGRFEDVTKRGVGGKLYDARELVLDPPEAAKVGVAVKGHATPSWAVANWLESADFDDKGQPRNLWKTKPALMLAKAAAALALRRTFQAEFQTLREQFGGRVAITVEDDPAGALYAPDESDPPSIHEGFVLPDGSEDEDEPEPAQPVRVSSHEETPMQRDHGDQGDPDAFWKLARKLGYPGQAVAPAVFGVPTMLAWMNADKSRDWDKALAALNDFAEAQMPSGEPYVPDNAEQASMPMTEAAAVGSISKRGAH